MNNKEYLDFFNRYICPNVKEFEEIRRNYLSGFILIYILAIMIFVYMLIVFDIVHNFRDEKIWIWLFIGGYLIVCFSHPVACMLITRYRSVIKEKFLNSMLNTLYGLKYYNGNPTIWTNIAASFGMNNLTDNHMSVEKLMDLSVASGCTYSFDDYIKGIYKNKNIEIQELSFLKFTGRGTLPFFHGLVMSVDLRKDFTGNIVFYSDKEVCIRSNNTGLEQVFMEDIEFNKIFTVYSNNQIDARYIFNPVFMETLKSVTNNNLDYKINGEIKNNELYIIISSAKNWFEIPFFKSANTPLVYYQPINDLKNLFSIIDSVCNKTDSNTFQL